MEEDIGYGHASAFYALLEELLQRACQSLKNITHVAVTRGPGSFTGVRVGLSIAKGLQLSGGMPILGLTTFDVLAHKHLCLGKQIFAIDTKRQDFYTALYDNGVYQEASIMSAEELENQQGALIFSDKHEVFERATPVVVSSEDVASAAWHKLQRGYQGFSSDPFYLRPPKVYES